MKIIKCFAIAVTLFSSMATADVFSATGGGFRPGMVLCPGASTIGWDPSCQTGLFFGTDEVNATEFLYGGNGPLTVFNLDPITGGSFGVFLPGQPADAATDAFGDGMYRFSGGTVSYTPGGAGVSGHVYGGFPTDEPSGYQCIESPISSPGCALSPALSMSFGGMFIGNVFVTFTSPGTVANVHGLVQVTVDPSLAAYAGFASTGGFIGEYNGSASEFQIRAATVPEPAAILLLLTIVAVLSLKRRNRERQTPL